MISTAAIAAVLACALAAGCGPATPGVSTTPLALRARLTRVIDGDTIRVRLNGRDQRVRLLGLDAPELHRPRTPIQCAARASARALAKLVHPGQPVTLTTDPTQDRYDRYQRLLAYARTATSDLQLAQLREGWASLDTYHHRPLQRQRQLERAAQAARAEHRGVWRLCEGDFHRNP